MATSLTIAPATHAEVPEAAAILLEVVRWLELRGEPLWTSEQVAADRLLMHAQAGELHLACLAGEAVGTFILQWEDRFAWPDVPAGESAFVHKLAVRRSVAGTGVGRAMVQWASDTARVAGRSYLRLDCAPRTRLCSFYENIGFERHSERLIGRYTLVRYQMALRPALM